jgi:hypothetical protein
MQVVSREDVEDGNPIPWSEVSNYVKPYPNLQSHHIHTGRDHDVASSIVHLRPEVNNQGKRIVYVEHAITGELTPILLDNPVAIDYSTMDDEYNDDNDEIEPLLSPTDKTNKKSLTNNLDFTLITSFYLRALYILIQGILAGFTFTTLYIQTAASPTDQTLFFLQIYSPIAGEIRRYCFLLSFISLIGSLDTIMTIYNTNTQIKTQMLKSIRTHKSRRPSSTEETPTNSLMTAALVLMLHLICFICTLSMSKEVLAFIW